MKIRKMKLVMKSKIFIDNLHSTPNIFENSNHNFEGKEMPISGFDRYIQEISTINFIKK